jgi:RimJ/RimL family protein N-acetyltransferase
MLRSDYKEWKRAYQSVLAPQSDFDDAPNYLEFITHTRFLSQLKKDRKSMEIGLIYNFQAFDKDSAVLIGDSQLWLVQRGVGQRATLGFSVLNNHWRLGFGFEIANATILHSIKVLNLNRIEAEVLPKNKPSISLCEKLGMKSEGIRRQALYSDGKWQDHLVFAITAEDLGIIGREPDPSFTGII